MGNYLYDSYEARMKVSNDYINDWNFYTKLKTNFVSPLKIAKFVQIIFITFKCPPYHTKFLQIFYNNLNLLERDENFHIVNELSDDLNNKLGFPESFNNFNTKLNAIKAQYPDKSIFNHGLVKTKEDALKYFFTYVNFHRKEFEKIKEEIKKVTEEILKYPQMNDDSNIKTIEKEENGVKIIYIGQVCDDLMEGKGMIKKINKSDNNIIAIIIGEFKNNNLNGFGIIKTENEQIEGIFKDGKMNGKMCLYNDSLIEYSEYKNGLKNGRTIKFNNDGTIVTYASENDIQKDITSIYVKSTDEFFTGKKKENGCYEGMLYGSEKGNIKVGNFNSKFELHGIGYLYNDGDGYYSTFNNGEFTDEPGFICEKDGSISIGKINKKGNINDENGLLLYYSNDNYKSDLYIGSFINGKMIGYGEYYWGHGDYEKAFNPEIWGVRYFHSSDTFAEGKLIRGFPKGPGFLTYKNKKYSGVFDLNDERDIFLEENGKAYRYNIGNSARNNEANATQYQVEQNN